MRTPSGSCQTACKPSESARKRLNRFAIHTILAGVGLLALALPAEARIVYTATNVTIKAYILHTQAMYGLDLNNDGVIDVTLSAGYVRLIPCVGGGWGPQAYAGETPAPGNGAEGPPAALEKGDLIGPSQTYHAQRGELEAYYGCSGDRFGAFGSQERYLGLMLRIHGETHYGWARLSVIANGAEASTTVTGYAYETTPGTPINAGQTTGAEDASALRPGVAYPKDSGPGASVSDPTQAVSSGMLALSEEVPVWRRKEPAGALPENI